MGLDLICSLPVVQVGSYKEDHPNMLKVQSHSQSTPTYPPGFEPSTPFASSFTSQEEALVPKTPAEHEESFGSEDDSVFTCKESESMTRSFRKGLGWVSLDEEEVI